MSDQTPFIFVSLVALGMGLAFISADRGSRTSRALAAGMGLIGISIYLNAIFINGSTEVPSWSGWLALPEALAIIAMLEWLLRVRNTVPAAGGMDVRTGDTLLRVGQGAAFCYFLFSLWLPDTRAEMFLHAATTRGAFAHWGFWLFATPLIVAQLTGLAAILLLLNRKPDRGETIRVTAIIIASPLLIAGFVLPMQQAALSVVLGEIVFMIGAVHYHVLQGNRGQFLSRFLSPQVASLVSDRGLDSAMQQNYLEVTVVFCDIRGFTPYAQAHPPSRVIEVLREYYDAVGRVVADYGGTIKDFAGDGILILIGAPLPMPRQGRVAIEMSRRVREVAQQVTRRWSVTAHQLGIGVGVASGHVAVGIIGAASRLEYTAVGPSVNLACRLCEIAADGEILVDSRTVELAGETGLEARGPGSIKGFAEPVPYFAVP
jgi:class 3 adenylate cyclase